MQSATQTTTKAAARAVLFDLDGTLLDPAKGIIGAVQSALQSLRRPAPPAESLRWVIGPPLRELFPRILGDETLTEQAYQNPESLQPAAVSCHCAPTAGLEMSARPTADSAQTLAAPLAVLLAKQTDYGTQQNPVPSLRKYWRKNPPVWCLALPHKIYVGWQ